MSSLMNSIYKLQTTLDPLGAKLTEAVGGKPAEITATPVPAASTVTAMPDYDSLANKAVRKKALIDAANRKGRMSTILTATDLTDNSEKLGG